MKKILIDIDEVICDSGFLNLLNEHLNTNYSTDDFTNYYLEDNLNLSKKERLAFYNYIKDKNPYANAKLYKDARSTIKKLNAKYEVYICSAFDVNNPALKETGGVAYYNKYNFLIKNFPFIDPAHFIFTSAKNLVYADIKIDDKVSNLQSLAETKLLYTAFHNKNISKEELDKAGIIRVNNWKEIADLLL